MSVGQVCGLGHRQSLFHIHNTTHTVNRVRTAQHNTHSQQCGDRCTLLMSSKKRWTHSMIWSTVPISWILRSFELGIGSLKILIVALVR